MSTNEQQIWSGENFGILLPSRPHVDRIDGGHLVIYPKRDISYRHEMTRNEARELASLLMAAERAYLDMMEQVGLPLVWLNIQDNGNWALLRGEDRSFHIHLYGRRTEERKQTPGQSLYFPGPESTVYDENEPLTEDDLEVFVRLLEENLKYIRQLKDDVPCFSKK